MTPMTTPGSMPNVGGISAASRQPSRPLVPAPREINRPPARSDASASRTARAIAGISARTAAGTWASSSLISRSAGSTSNASRSQVRGLIPSVSKVSSDDASADCGAAAFLV